MELNVLAAGGEIGIDAFQDGPGSSGRETRERQAGNDAVGFREAVFFQMYIDIFGTVADDDQAGIFYVSQFFCEIRLDLKTKKNAPNVHFFQYFLRDYSSSSAQFNDAIRVLKIYFGKHLVGENGRTLDDRSRAKGIFEERFEKYIFVLHK